MQKNSIARFFSPVSKSEFWISLFIVVYIVTGVISLFYKEPKLANFYRIFMIGPNLFGTDQFWSLFSPDLKNYNAYNVAIVTFADSSFKIYEWPRMERSDEFEKARNEKYRKMFVDCMPFDDFRPFLPSTARFVARANKDPENPPTSVALAMISGKIPPPELAVARSELPWWNTYRTYYRYRVQPEDLR
jgi:hypothetical protein